jgi:HEAT repeat protein
VNLSESASSGLWRLLPGVFPPERPRFLFFLSLSGLIVFSQTIGLATAEALFLARVGVVHLPLAFVLASAVTVAGSLAYAWVVGRRRNDLLFIQILLFSGGGLAVLGLAVRYRLPWAPAALICAFYLTNAVFLNHFWTFAGDYFDILANKRLFPLFQIGASIGGLLGGAVTALASRLGSAEILVFAWGVGLGFSALFVGAAHSRLRRWYPVELEEMDESSVEGIRVAVRFLRQSTLGRNLVLSTLGMILSLFVLQYLYSEVFIRSFPDEAKLATFLGLYLAVTNLLEIGFEGAVTPWLIHRLGVGAANLAHPVLTLASFGLLAFDYRLHAGLFARVNREMLENCLAGPVRAMVQNALPARLRGKMRAFLEGIVVHAGMVLAGGLLILIGPVADPRWICAAGGAAALLYLAANLAVRHAYLESLVTGVRSGRVDLRERSDEFGAREIEHLVGLWRSVVLDETQLEPSPAVRQLARLLARRGVLDPLLEAFSKEGVAVRRATVEALGSECPDRAAVVLVQALDDPDAEVRLFAVRACDRGEGDDLLPEARVRLRVRLDDPDPRVRAEAARRIGPEGERVLAEMVLEKDPAIAEAALRSVPPSLVSLILQRADDGDPRIRAASIEATSRLGGPAPLDLSRLTEELRHHDTGVRCAAISALGTRPEPDAQAVLAGALADPARDVRRAATVQLSRLGEHGVALVARFLDGQPVWATEAAFGVIAQSGAEAAQTILISQLRLRARQAWTALQVLSAIPQDGDLPARFLRAAYEDALVQNRRLAFRILELLEEPALVRSVEKVLLFDTGRLRAEALEVLSHLGDREAASFLVMTLERASLPPTEDLKTTLRPGAEDLHQVLSEARRALDRWIRVATAAHEDKPAVMEATMERLLALRNVSLFSQMSLDQLEAINGLLVESQFVSGEVIVREGDPGRDLYVITKGSVDIIKNFGSDQEIHLSRLAQGSVVGEIAVLDESPRTATGVAREDCTVLGLRGDRFRELIYDMPELAFAIFTVLTERLRGADQRFEEFVQTSGGPTAGLGGAE